MKGALTLSDREYSLIRDLVYQRFGINLTEQKKALIIGRLQKILRQNGFENFTKYYNYVEADRTGEALNTLIDRISTNYTFFNRENQHFNFFSRIILPEMTSIGKHHGNKVLRVWCAGCSSGEEPYTLSMLILEFFGHEIRSWDVGVLATDISRSSLEKARTGINSDENIASLPASRKLKYCQRLDKKNWIVKDEVKDIVLFRRLNLMRQTFPFKGKLHVIFCRNVMIYFDHPTKIALVRRFYESTEPGGYLFIGHSESLGRADCPYRYIQPATYRREPRL